MNKKAFVQDFKKNPPKTKPQFLNSKVIDDKDDTGTTLQSFYNHAREEWVYSVMLDKNGKIVTKYESNLGKI